MSFPVSLALVAVSVTGIPATAGDAVPVDPHESTWALEWRAPEPCPSPAVFQRRVENLVERPIAPGVWDELSVAIDVEAERGGRPHRAKISITGREGAFERELEHPDSCVQLAEGVALIVSLAIERELEVIASEPTSASNEPGVVPTPPAPAPSLEVRRETPSRGRPSFALRLGPEFVLAAGQLPGASPGVGGVVALEARGLQLLLGGAYWGRRQVEVQAGPSSAAAEFRAWSVGARVGYGWVLGRWVPFLAAGADGGEILADAGGLASGSPQRAAWGTASVSLGLRVDVARRLSVVARVDPYAPLTRPRFFVEGAGTVHQPAAFGVRGGLGLVFAVVQ